MKKKVSLFIVFAFLAVSMNSCIVHERGGYGGGHREGRGERHHEGHHDNRGGGGRGEGHHEHRD